jgi:hypothetical protein
VLPARLEPVLAKLLADSAPGADVTLDAIGEAIGVIAVSTDDVDALMAALEGAGRVIRGPEGARGVGNLQRVLRAARDLAVSLGRRPTLAEIAAHTGLSGDDVKHALALGRVMGR